MKELIEKRAELLDMLSNPTRLCIVLGLYKNGPRCVGEIQNCTKVPQSNVSRHLALLKTAGIVRATRVANQMRYELVNDDVVSIIEVLFKEDFR